MREQALVTRRAFLYFLAIAGAGPLTSNWSMHRIFAQGAAPAVITPDAERPSVPFGVASGDATSTPPLSGAARTVPVV
jgi:alkaline phosphatase D